MGNEKLNECLGGVYRKTQPGEILSLTLSVRMIRCKQVFRDLRQIDKGLASVGEALGQGVRSRATRKPVAGS